MFLDRFSTYSAKTYRMILDQFQQMWVTVKLI